MNQCSEIDKEDNRPKWLLELENRKQKPRLAHEAGAGALCLKCENGCPGLDLHFWRKICKNCKCGRDDHDISDNEFPQFDLLLGPSGKSKHKFIVLKLNKQPINNEETFEWAPPDTTTELAADYMKALPEGKLPIKGSIGAALRKQQLQKQLPLHDIDHKVCDELSDMERKQFEKYLENLKTYVGQGKVSKIESARPFDISLMTPANASECLSPKHTPNVIPNQPPINLRTPSSFVLKYSSPLRSLSQSQEELLTANKNTELINDFGTASNRLENIGTPDLDKTIDPVKPVQYHHIVENIKTQNPAESTINVGSVQYSANFSTTTKLSRDGNQLKQMSDISGNKSEIEENKMIDMNAKYDSTIEKSQLMALKNNENTSLISLIDKDNDVPLDVTQLNLHCNNVKYSPFSPHLQRVEGIISKQSTIEHNSVKSPLRSNKLKQQSIESPHNHLDTYSEHSHNSMRTANKILSETLLPPNAVPNTDIIGSTLDQKELSSIREKLMAKYNIKYEPIEYSIHQDHNNPSLSRNLRRDKVQESNHATSINLINADVNSKSVQAYMNFYKNPDHRIIRSEKFQNPIFPDETAVGTSKISTDNLELPIDKLSIKQSQEFKVQKCHQCDGGIYGGDVVVTAERATDAVWHPGCFVCCACNELLVDLVYFYYKGKLYCARDLANLMEIPRCFACDELIFVREYTVAEEHNYHVKHFCCWDCDIPLAGKQYISENDRPLCLQCYQKTYAKLCCACNKLIAADQQGVAVKNLNFHATNDCFCCYNCNKGLLNGRMAIKEEKPFCSKECIVTYFNRNDNLR